ncbi:MAG: GTPase ObgE, partial [Kiritimatiellaeota bacterium]|nr:GTPase ObgE [Kiritimatiellota bacterium]
MKAITFMDRVRIQALAGNGGDGCKAFRREKYEPHGGPAGGDGGRGGSVFLRGDKDVDSLLDLYFQPLQRAEHGEPGRGKDQYGRHGADRVIRVPQGTEVRDAASGVLLAEVLADGEQRLIARGGKGGLGNRHFATSSHRAPTETTPGQRGEQKKLLLEMKTVADVGLVGYPNAGKSSLLRAISAARPKVGAYPFTTLHPVIGTVVYTDYAKLRVADIPGLIDGAHAGVGLGHDFLRHIERTRFLLIVLDMAGSDNRDPVDDYRNLLKELKLYRADLLDRPRLVVANKMDLPEAVLRLKEFKRRTRQKPLRLSAATGLGVAELKAALSKVFFDPAAPAPAA